ncbi:MAG: glutamyl-tRNA reductase [Planctomycetes bacterium]|nr:glutamyl-tRNA reductase [Planctomycetota bacterium]
MKIIMLGVNHRTAPVGLREQLTITGERMAAALTRLRAAHPASELVILSTCNRTEVYLARPAHEPPTAEQLTDFLSGYCGADRAALAASVILRENEQAVAHLFRVCAGLDSMVLGESQIVGQVKRAYEQAQNSETVGPVLHKVFQQAIAVSKEARSKTGIDTGRVSVGSVAVDFAQRIFERFDDKTVVGIGAGDMAKLTLRHLASLRPAKLWVTNRTPQRAQSLIERLKLPATSAGVRPFEALDELLVEADIVLTSTGSQKPIITAERFKPLLRKRRFRPLFIIDIAVPRDVDPRVGGLNNVYLYNIDDLQGVVAANVNQRSEQVRECEAILFEEVRSCYAEVQNRDVGRLIKALRQRLHDLGRLEHERTARKMSAAAPDEMPAILEEHTNRLINKILHLPLSQLDQSSPEAPLGFYAAALRRLFDLKEESRPGPPVDGEKVAPPVEPDTPPAPTTGTAATPERSRS